MGIIAGQVIGDAWVGAVHLGAAEGFCADLLAGRCLDQRRAGQKDGGLLPDHDGLVRHGGYIGAACGAEPHHHRQLGDVLGRHASLVVKDATKMIAVGKHLVLHRQKGAAGIHQIEAGEAQPFGDGLGPQVLFHRERVVGATLHGGIVHHQHAEPPRDEPDAGDDAGGGHRLVIDLPGGQRREFEKGGARVQQLIDALAGQQFAAGLMTGIVGGAAALGYLVQAGIEIVDQRLHGGPIGRIFRACGIEAGVKSAHALSPISSRPMSQRRISEVPAPIS